MATNCTFYDSTKVILNFAGIDFDGDQLAEAIKIDSVEAITAEKTLSGTTYSSANNRDYGVTVKAVKGSDLHSRLEQAFLRRECNECGIFDYNENANLAIVTDSVVILSRAEVSVGLSEAVEYKLHARWTNV